MFSKKKSITLTDRNRRRTDFVEMSLTLSEFLRIIYIQQKVEQSICPRFTVAIRDCPKPKTRCKLPYGFLCDNSCGEKQKYPIIPKRPANEWKVRNIWSDCPGSQIMSGRLVAEDKLLSARNVPTSLFGAHFRFHCTYVREQESTAKTGEIPSSAINHHPAGERRNEVCVYGTTVVVLSLSVTPLTKTVVACLALGACR